MSMVIITHCSTKTWLIFLSYFFVSYFYLNLEIPMNNASTARYPTGDSRSALSVCRLAACGLLLVAMSQGHEVPWDADGGGHLQRFTLVTRSPLCRDLLNYVTTLFLCPSVSILLKFLTFLFSIRSMAIDCRKLVSVNTTLHLHILFYILLFL